MIGLSMIVLVGLLWLLCGVLVVLVLVLIVGYNLLDGVWVMGDGLLVILWKVLY